METWVLTGTLCRPPTQHEWVKARGPPGCAVRSGAQGSLQKLSWAWLLTQVLLACIWLDAGWVPQLNSCLFALQ